MTRRRSTAALAGLLAATLALTIGGFVLIAANWPRPLEHAEWGFPGFQGIAALVFAAVGTPVAWRRPANPIGWLYLAAGATSALQFLGHQYAIFGILTAPGSVPAAWAGTWIEEWIWMPILATMGIFPFLLFPTGHFASDRWRRAAIAILAVLVVTTPAGLFVPLTRVPGAVNPLAGAIPTIVVDLLVAAAIGVLIPGLFVAWASVAFRFRRSTGVERQQLKWLALGGLVVAIGMTIYTAGIVVTGDPYGPLSGLLALALFAVPVAMAVAMLRHGLYEVDRLLNRTVVYALVSAVLAAVYGASVVVFQALLDPITTGDGLAVAGSTLLVASVFQPVRGRVQHAIDRRFFRSRYDAQATVERFGLHLREELDLRSIVDGLVAEVTRTVRPAGAALWLRRQ